MYVINMISILHKHLNWAALVEVHGNKRQLVVISDVNAETIYYFILTE